MFLEEHISIAHLSTDKLSTYFAQLSSAGKKIFQREGAHNDVPRLTKGQHKDLATESGELIPTCFSGNDSIIYAFATSCHINTCEDDLCSWISWWDATELAALTSVNSYSLHVSTCLYLSLRVSTCLYMSTYDCLCPSIWAVNHFVEFKIDSSSFLHKLPAWAESFVRNQSTEYKDVIKGSFKRNRMTSGRFGSKQQPWQPGKESSEPGQNVGKFMNRGPRNGYLAIWTSECDAY